MTGTTIGLIIVGFLFFLLIIRVHIGVAMFLAGAVGYAWISGVDPLMAHLKHAVYGRYSVYDLSVVPLFLMMGQFATQGGLSQALFRAANAFIGHWRGGMAMAGIASCAGFGAICGSSLATAATMSHVVLPELRRHQYAPSLAGASLAVGGTLGMLIPPSVPLVIYAILAEQNIAKVFMASFLPGALAIVGYIVVVGLMVHFKPELAGPKSEAQSWALRLKTLAATWPVMLIFGAVIFGIYTGIFTPTEAAAVGTVATGLMAWYTGGLKNGGLKRCMQGTAIGTGMMFLILVGADMLNSFLAVSQIPANFAEWVQGLGLSPLSVLFAIIIVYILLGCVMDSLSMILLTVPIFLPVILGMDFWGLDMDEKAIWFGILALVVMEMGLITPPVGMNVFIIHNIARDISPGTIFRGIVPFLTWDVIRIVILVMFPSISLILIQHFG